LIFIKTFIINHGVFFVKLFQNMNQINGLIDSIIFSPAIVTYRDEVIEQARLFTGWFDMDGTYAMRINI